MQICPLLIAVLTQLHYVRRQEVAKSPAQQSDSTAEQIVLWSYKVEGRPFIVPPLEKIRYIYFPNSLPAPKSASIFLLKK